MYVEIDIREKAKSIHWDCIAITCSDPKFSVPLEREINIMAKAGLLPKHDLHIVVDDPQPSRQGSPFGVGSGGATVNALLIVTEKLSSLTGATTINSDMLYKCRILVIHYGRQSYHYCGGNVFLPVDAALSWIPPSLARPAATLLEHTIWMASVIASESKNGVWISSLDFFMPYSPSVSIPSHLPVDRALICSIDPSVFVSKSSEHGFLCCDDYGKLKKVNYKSIQALQVDDKQMQGIISGTSYFGPSLAENVVSLHTLPPLDRCTYYGTDSCTEPVQISLYFDLLLPMCSETNEQAYVSGELSYRYAEEANYSTLMLQEGVRARQNIWNQLNKYEAFEHQLRVNSAVYINPSLPYKDSLKHVLNYCSESDNSSFFLNFARSSNVVPFNSLIECNVLSGPSHKAFLINCSFDSSSSMLKIEGDCVLSDFEFKGESFQLNCGENIVWQNWTLSDGNTVVTCHGFEDSLFADRKSPSFKMFNKSWEEFSSALNVTPDDIWDSDSLQTLSRAKLYTSKQTMAEQLATMEVISNRKVSPEHLDRVLNWKRGERLSLGEIRSNRDFTELLNRRQRVFIAVLKRMIQSLSDGKSASFVPSYQFVTSLSQEKTLDLVSFFHRELRDDHEASSRLLAHVSDVLGSLAGPEGGLRSGPAGNWKWIPAFTALKEGKYELGIDLLEPLCLELIKSGKPEEIMRAARHYERASHIMISKQVETARLKVFPLERSANTLSLDTWVEANCPARLDLAGGWTDTPPVCYEMGGAVLNLAIKINGRKPIGAKARICKELEITCTLIDSSGAPLRLVWKEMEDLEDYDNPVALGALVKACILCSELVLPRPELGSLQQQLKKRCNGGLEVFVWSELAQGSGLGGSSLLAATILSVLFIVQGCKLPTPAQLIHATLCVEQMLTTGGGWQDQVGGLIGGMKLGVSRPKIPLEVEVFSVPLSDDLLSALNSQLLLVYTGKVRLARNLLQTVLRNWYAREARITGCFRELLSVALTSAKSLVREDVAGLGRCIDQYWSLKKSVASGCEPQKVKEFMSLSEPMMLGQCLAGAGGGGYLYGLTSHPNAVTKEILPPSLKDMKFDEVEVDVEGLAVSVGGRRVLCFGSDETKLTTDLLQDLTTQLLP